MVNISTNRNGNERKKWILALGFFAWGVFIFFSVKGFFLGETGDEVGGGFLYIFLPIIMVFIGVGMRGTPLPEFVSLLWILAALAINLGLIFLVCNAIVYTYRKSRICASVVLAITLIIPFGGSWLNNYFALFRYRYTSAEECSAHSFLLNRYCKHVFAKEHERKTDITKCRNLGSDKRGDCVSEVARYTNNPDLCEINLVNYNREREACYSQFRQELGSEGVCDRIRGKDNRYKSSVDECYTSLAVAENDPKKCERIPPINDVTKGNDWLGFCLTQLAWAKQDISLCHRIRELSPISNEFYTCIKKFEQGHW